MNTPSPVLRLALVRSMALASIALMVAMSLIFPGVQRASAQGADSENRILVFGAADNGTERLRAAQMLRELGPDVDESPTLPQDLSQYSQVWHVSAYDSLSPQDQGSLVDFVNRGGGLYLTGERPCCMPLNSSVQALMRSLTGNQELIVGSTSDIGGPFTFNPSAADGLSRSPRLLVDFVPDSPGQVFGIGGISGRNVFASSPTTAVAAAWDESDMTSGLGRVVLMMDIDYLNKSSAKDVVTNISEFLGAGQICSPDDGAISWNNQVKNCDTISVPGYLRYEAWVPYPARIDISYSIHNGVGECTESRPGPSGQEGRLVVLNCRIDSVSSSSGEIMITATSSDGTVSKRMNRFYPKNDARNVPTGHSPDSNWWDWPDTDGDGIPDHWEQNGVWVNDSFLDLRSEGARVGQMDLFLMLEHEEGHALNSNVRALTADAFRDMEVKDHGSIHAHLMVGQSVPRGFVDGGGYGLYDLVRAQLHTGFASSPWAGGRGVPPIAHWNINIDDSGTDGITGTGWFKSNKSITHLGDEFRSRRPFWPDSAVEFAQATNLAHEVGHQLGLNHHGAEGAPNDDREYHSVMSYAYSIMGVGGRNLRWIGQKEGTITYSDREVVNYDLTLGRSMGQLTFVVGQFGERPSQYEALLNDSGVMLDLDTLQESTELDDHEMLKTAPPSLHHAFADAHAFPPPDEFPEVRGPSAVEVPANDTVDLNVMAEDKSGRPINWTLANESTLGEIEVVEGRLILKAGGNSGFEVLRLRADNGVYSSEEHLIEVSVVAPVNPGPGTGSAGSLGSLGGS